MTHKNKNKRSCSRHIHLEVAAVSSSVFDAHTCAYPMRKGMEYGPMRKGMEDGIWDRYMGWAWHGMAWAWDGGRERGGGEELIKRREFRGNKEIFRGNNHRGGDRADSGLDDGVFV